MAPEFGISFEFRRKPETTAEESQGLFSALRPLLDENPIDVEISHTQTASMVIQSDSLEGALGQMADIYRSDALPVGEGYVLHSTRVEQILEDKLFEGPRFQYPPELKVDNRRVKMLDMFAQIFRPGKKIYYPGSHIDVSPSMVPGFEDSDITYLDTQENVVRSLKQGGLEAHHSDVEKYDPGEVDVLLFLGFYNKKALQFVKPGGYTVFGTGVPLPPQTDIEGFRLTAIVGLEQDKKPFLDKNNLEQYIEGRSFANGMFILTKQ